MRDVLNAQYKTAIEAFYQFHIEQCIPGPQQYVAKTAILTDENAKQYFCKIVKNELITPQIMQTLSVVQEMHQKGIENISYPIRGKDGFYRDHKLQSISL